MQDLCVSLSWFCQILTLLFPSYHSNLLKDCSGDKRGVEGTERSHPSWKEADFEVQSTRGHRQAPYLPGFSFVSGHCRLHREEAPRPSLFMGIERMHLHHQSKEVEGVNEREMLIKDFGHGSTLAVAKVNHSH